MMKVYYNQIKAQVNGHAMRVCPAGDPFTRGKELPSFFVDDENKPVTFDVVFEHGIALVDDELGRYMIEAGLADKHHKPIHQTTL